MRKVKPHETVSVDIDTATLARMNSGKVAGVISLRIDDESFPEAQWNDFPVLVLEMWLRAVCQLYDGRAKDVRLHFMDGPFWVDVSPEDDNWILRCVDDRKGRGTEGPTTTIGKKSFIAIVAAAANKLVAGCHANGWQDDAVNALEQALGVARAAIRQRASIR